MGITFKKLKGNVSAETVKNEVIDTLSKQTPEDSVTCEKNNIIIVNYENDEEIMPLTVVKCMSSSEKISENIIKQTKQYAESIKAVWVAVTNGKNAEYFHYNQETDWYSIKCMPYWCDMYRGNCHWFYSWITFEDLEKEGIPQYVDAGNIGDDTPVDLQTAMVNLYECLLDKEVTFPVCQYQIFTLIKDIGIRFGFYGNASGGHFEGLYRSFLIDFEGKKQLISIGMSGYCTHSKPDIIKTAICVAIDSEDKSHHALQLVVDNNNLCISGDRVIFQHDGKIGNAPKGSSIKEEKLFIERYYPYILRNNRIYLGELPSDRLWNISDPDVVELIENLISYALIRDKYRDYIKSKNEAII